MLLVQKYGGSSVGSPERIRAVAKRVANARRRGHDLVVVVSAMGDTTDDLTTLASLVTGRERPQDEHPREMDMLLTAGERIAAALLTMAIREQGFEARSFTGSQAAIITDTNHTAARIREVKAGRVREALDDGCIAIVAGFQGVSTEREITTLGRGGSDTTAVALAAALKADACEIYTDVDGVYTADPRRVPGARVIRTLTHAEMMEMAANGAQVMHGRAVDIGDRFGVDIRVLSSFVDDDAADEGAPRGTLITHRTQAMEELVLTGVAPKGGQAKLVLRGLAPGMRTQTVLLEALAENGVSVDMVNESFGGDGRMQIQLTVPEEAASRAEEVLRAALEPLGGGEIAAQTGLSRIALVGNGMTGRPGVYAKAYRALLDAGVEVQGVSTSSISITVLVPAERETEAVQALHGAFRLEQTGAADGVAER
ncbi:aspartate kinase [Longimicrobium sp.]|uniref:aspartate kinase n=1 Tax=Longimicrobium sp. TaxID=2029185 RepID=UPI002C469647|nr:aspartate kinase [Longimicrobium sp.]HSU14865.1 aspartate kinase [Longimicrobium sp.]